MYEATTQTPLGFVDGYRYLGLVSCTHGDGTNNWFSASTALYECEECGATVTNPESHFQWHERPAVFQEENPPSP